MNQQSTLVWRRAPQGEFFLEGSLPKTRRVRIAINGKVGHHAYKKKEALQLIQDAIASGHAPANEYALLPVETESRR